ncbi:MAG: sulfotransferase [Thermodesulfobacteriota bacterium]|nr:sulfotransferase [Thermodesulfobacteriota bacterium]
MLDTLSPIIVIGMHRSGTSLFARLLDRAGIFMGAKRSRHDEAYFFLRKNQWLFKLAHAEWDNPKPVRHLLHCRDIREKAVRSLKKALESIEIRGYLGWRNLLAARSLENFNRPWGWKDPRSSYTLPLWMDIFPKARVIHVIRNGPDVAGSLWVREQKRRGGLNNPLASCRCRDLDEAFSLWAEYVRECVSVIDTMPDTQAIQIRYEDFLAKPEREMRHVLGFLNIDLDDKALTDAVEDIRPEYSYRFLKDTKLHDLYDQQQNHPLMKRFAYDKVPGNIETEKL